MKARIVYIAASYSLKPASAPSELLDADGEKVRIGDDCRKKRGQRRDPVTSSWKASRTRSVPDNAPQRAHPCRDRVDHLRVREDVGERDAADEEAAREEVPKVERPRRVLGGEVVCACAARAEPVGEGGKGEEDGCVRSTGSQGQLGRRGWIRRHAHLSGEGASCSTVRRRG